MKTPPTSFVGLRLDRAMVTEIDTIRKGPVPSRTDIIKQAIAEYLRRQKGEA